MPWAWVAWGSAHASAQRARHVPAGVLAGVVWVVWGSPISDRSMRSCGAVPRYPQAPAWGCGRAVWGGVGGLGTTPTIAAISIYVSKY